MVYTLIDHRNDVIKRSKICNETTHHLIFCFFDSTSCFMTWEQQALRQLLLVSNQLVVDVLWQKC